MVPVWPWAWGTGPRLRIGRWWENIQDWNGNGLSYGDFRRWCHSHVLQTFTYYLELSASGLSKADRLIEDKFHHAQSFVEKCQIFPPFQSSTCSLENPLEPKINIPLWQYNLMTFRKVCIHYNSLSWRKKSAAGFFMAVQHISGINSCSRNSQMEWSHHWNTIYIKVCSHLLCSSFLEERKTQHLSSRICLQMSNPSSSCFSVATKGVLQKKSLPPFLLQAQFTKNAVLQSTSSSRFTHRVW